MTVRVVGLDLSLSSTGVTVPDGTCRTIRPHAGSNDNGRRLHEIVTRVDLYLKASKPDVAVVETVFVYRNRKTAMLLAGLGWCVRHRLFEADIAYVDVDNNQVKEFAVGDHRASKDDMVAAARISGAEVANDDEAIAWWLWAMGRMQFSTWEPAFEMVGLRDVRRRVLLAVGWPKIDMAART